MTIVAKFLHQNVSEHFENNFNLNLADKKYDGYC